jgi:hypothetical protein
MKTCTRCKQDKSLDEFPKRAKSTDGLASWCKTCKSEYSARVYQTNEDYREKRRKTSENRRAANRELLWQYLLDHPCVDCNNADPRVLEFDHRESKEKVWAVASMFSWSWSTIEYEIAKCDVRCANCHAIRTQNQFDTWRSKM